MENGIENVGFIETAEPANGEYLGNNGNGRHFTFSDMEVECFYGDLPIEKILAEICK